MPFPYKTVLVTGATSGLGRALAERMADAGIFVIAVGRRKVRLDELVEKHGPNKVAAEVFDVSDLSKIGGWAKKITKTYPNLDSIVLNAGFQRSVDFTNPSTIDLALIDDEATTNYLSPVHTIAAFLPHLISLGAPPSASRRPASIVLVTSGLAIVPVARCANYCATKAALHSLAWTLRSQLSAPQSRHTQHIRVVEVVPPAVQTELHSHQADLVALGQGNVGMELGPWADETWSALRGEERQSAEDEEWADEFMVAMLRGNVGTVEAERKKTFKKFEGMMRGMKQ